VTPPVVECPDCRRRAAYEWIERRWWCPRCGWRGPVVEDRRDRFEPVALGLADDDDDLTHTVVITPDGHATLHCHAPMDALCQRGALLLGCLAARSFRVNDWRHLYEGGDVPPTRSGRVLVRPALVGDQWYWRYPQPPKEES
jgi:hypothetical protein